MTDAYVPLTGPPTWHHAACRGEDPELWFPIASPHEPTPKLKTNRAGETAEDICQRCPYSGDLGECANWAREARNPRITAGIWGGIDMNNGKNQRPRPQCALDGCNNRIGRGREKYCSDLCYREAELRVNRERQRRRRQERRQAALLRP
jgi:Transcription factor WhiB